MPTTTSAASLLLLAATKRPVSGLSNMLYYASIELRSPLEVRGSMDPEISSPRLGATAPPVPTASGPAVIWTGMAGAPRGNRANIWSGSPLSESIHHIMTAAIFFQRSIWSHSVHSVRRNDMGFRSVFLVGNLR